ncbi:MAG TPA: ABC transporter permease, partial [Symbiobacteriaceae bacterium]|nr:ABC transporter permease [Symbiobacteriaceae bacterium]
LWSSATDIGRERWMGTLEILLIAPVRFPTVLLGKILGNTLLGALSVGLSWFYSWALLGVRMTVAHPLQLAITVVAAIFAFVGFALMLALLFTLSRNANSIANGLGYPLYVVSGLLFPLTVLPVWVLPIGLSLPLAWAREALRWATTGAVSASTLLTPNWAVAAGGLVTVGLVYFVAAYGLYRYVFDRKLRQLGQLGVS